MNVDRFLITEDAQKHALQELICSLCQKVPTKPVACPNQHYFCNGCIEAHLSTSSTCPKGDEPLKKGEPRPCRLHEKIIGLFKVRCDNRRDPSGALSIFHRQKRCTWIGPFSNLAQHEQECPFRSMPCPTCGQSVLANFLEAHTRQCSQNPVKCELCRKSLPRTQLNKHYEECPMSSVCCPNHCVVRPEVDDVLIMRRRDVDAHLAVCPNRVHACDFAQMGCSFQGNQKELHYHSENCIRLHLKLITKSHAKLLAMLQSLGATFLVDDANASLDMESLKSSEDDQSKQSPSVSNEVIVGGAQIDGNTNPHPPSSLEEDDSVSLTKEVDDLYGTVNDDDDVARRGSDLRKTSTPASSSSSSRKSPIPLFADIGTRNGKRPGDPLSYDHYDVDSDSLDVTPDTDSISERNDSGWVESHAEKRFKLSD